MPESRVNVRYMVNDVDAAITFYTTHLGFSLLTLHPPSLMSPGGPCVCCSAVQQAQPVEGCLTVANPGPVAGTEFNGRLCHASRKRAFISDICPNRRVRARTDEPREVDAFEANLASTSRCRIEP